jgi:hypothetical protein
MRTRCQIPPHRAALPGNSTLNRDLAPRPVRLIRRSEAAPADRTETRNSGGVPRHSTVWLARGRCGFMQVSAAVRSARRSLEVRGRRLDTGSVGARARLERVLHRTATHWAGHTRLLAARGCRGATIRAAPTSAAIEVLCPPNRGGASTPPGPDSECALAGHERRRALCRHRRWTGRDGGCVNTEASCASWSARDSRERLHPGA